MSGNGSVLSGIKSINAVFKTTGHPVSPDNQKLGWTS